MNVKSCTHFVRLVRRGSLVLAVAAGLLPGLFAAYGAPPQAAAVTDNETRGASDAAQQAYQDLAAKNFAAAVEHFKNALALEPSNERWRKDMAYALVSAGSLAEAVTEFQRIYSEHPDQLEIALQLGYLSQQLSRVQEAIRYFGDAERSSDRRISEQASGALAVLRPSELLTRKQAAYDLAGQGRRVEAIRLFEELHRDDPADASATLQLGYLYDAAGEKTKARQMFEAARQNADPQIARQAASALDQIRRDSKLWFGSLYASPFYQSRFSNEINPLHVQIGIRAARYVQPYIGLRFNRDVRSKSGTLPQIFADNSVVFAFGIQSSLPRIGATFYAEAGTALDLLAQPTQGRAIPDYRTGALWFRSWGTGINAPAGAGHDFTLTGNAYADLGFYSRYDNNVIGSLLLREGFNLPTGSVLPIQLLAAINFVKDSNGNFYNNSIEVGPDLRIVPVRKLPNLQFEMQYLRGFYVTHDSTNPYRPRYGDFRAFLIWSMNF